MLDKQTNKIIAMIMSKSQVNKFFKVDFTTPDAERTAEQFVHFCRKALG